MKQRLDWLASVGVLVCAWAGAFAWTAAARLFANLYREFGGALPLPTERVIWLAEQQAPFGIAVVCTLVLVWVWLRRRSWIVPASVLMLSAVALGVAWVLFALALPSSLCGNLWPDWPAPWDGAAAGLGSCGPEAL